MSEKVSSESVPTLVGRLGDDILALLDTKVGLLKLEIREDVSAYARGGAVVVAGGTVVAVGLALVNVALAFLIAGFLENSGLAPPFKYAVAFAATGAVYLLVGTVIVVMTKDRLARRGVVPEKSLEELQKDRQWLTSER